MKLQTQILNFVLLGKISVLAAAQVPPDEDPVNISPQYYTVRFENDRVRVLEFRLPPGEKEPMHSHPPGIVRYLSDGKFRVTLPDGSEYETSVKKGDVSWRDFTKHAAENIGTTDALAFAIELKDAAAMKDSR